MSNIGNDLIHAKCWATAHVVAAAAIAVVVGILIGATLF